jgi:hypothetical protein
MQFTTILKSAAARLTGSSPVLGTKVSAKEFPEAPKIPEKSKPLGFFYSKAFRDVPIEARGILKTA